MQRSREKGEADVQVDDAQGPTGFKTAAALHVCAMRLPFAAAQLRAQDGQQVMQAYPEAEVGWGFGTCRQQCASAIHVCMSEH